GAGWRWSNWRAGPCAPRGGGRPRGSASGGFGGKSTVSGPPFQLSTTMVTSRPIIDVPSRPHASSEPQLLERQGASENTVPVAADGGIHLDREPLRARLPDLSRQVAEQGERCAGEGGERVPPGP